MKKIFLTPVILLGYLIGLTATSPSDKWQAGHLLEGSVNYLYSQNQILEESIGIPGRVCAGVNIHFVKGHEKDLDMIADAGFKYIRMDFVWQTIERSGGEYDWTAYEELSNNLEKRGLRAIYILDYSNPLYEEEVKSMNPINGKAQRSLSSPQHPESVAAFAQWAAAAATHFRDYDILWEIWNEPNIFFWKPQPSVKQYTTLAMATVKAIKDAVPEARVIGPATSEIPLSYLESFFSSGILEYLDAVSVHPYRNYAQSPETAAGEYRDLRKLIEAYAPAGKKDIPIISSEWGYASHTAGVSPEKQAAFCVRMQLSNTLHDIPLSIWYDWLNDGPDPAEREHNFGTVTGDLEPKPAYKAIQTLNHMLKGFIYSRRIDLEFDEDYVLLFRNLEGKTILVAWTALSTHPVRIDLPAQVLKNAAGIDGYGQPVRLESRQEGLLLKMDALPQYIELPPGSGLE